MQNDRDDEQTRCGFDPFTVSAVFCDGSGKLVRHCYASDAQAARDQVLMETGGTAVIASVFAGHLVEADADVFTLQGDSAAEIEAVGIGREAAGEPGTGAVSDELTRRKSFLKGVRPCEFQRHTDQKIAHNPAGQGDADCRTPGAPRRRAHGEAGR